MVEQAELFNLGIATSLGEGKLSVQKLTPCRMHPARDEVLVNTYIDTQYLCPHSYKDTFAPICIQIRRIHKTRSDLHAYAFVSLGTLFIWPCAISKQKLRKLQHGYTFVSLGILFIWPCAISKQKLRKLQHGYTFVSLGILFIWPCAISKQKLRKLLHPYTYWHLKMCSQG